MNANPRPTAQDLAGFWDLLQLSIEDISLKFDELYHLKSNDWKLNGDSPEKQVQTQLMKPSAGIEINVGIKLSFANCQCRYSYSEQCYIYIYIYSI